MEQEPTVVTGDGIEYFRWLSIRGMVKIEGKGLRFKGRTTRSASAKRLLGLPMNTKRDALLAAIEAKLAELRGE